MVIPTPQKNDLIGWMRKNNCAARAARFWLQFFDIVCQTTWVRDSDRTNTQGLKITEEKGAAFVISSTNG